ncbi:hypothetical protein DV737_g2819, partial [Chaetothyriales sp. CBS 132003]
MAQEQPIIIPPKRLETDYPVIDTDPYDLRFPSPAVHLKRAFRYARREDWVVGAGVAAFGPLFMLTLERFTPSFSSKGTFPPILRLSGAMGVLAGLGIVYQRSCLRFYGFTENKREEEMDMREMVDKVKRGEPLYGVSDLTPYMQGGHDDHDDHELKRASDMSASAEPKLKGIKFFDGSQQGESAKPGSALFQLSTVEGTRSLVEVLANAQVEGQEAVATHMAAHQLSVRKSQMARQILKALIECAAGTDWTNQDAEHYECLRHIKVKSVSLKVMETKEAILLDYLSASRDLVAGLKSLEKVARKLLVSQEEHGEEYFNDAVRQNVYAVTLKVIDDCWKTLQAGRLSVGNKLAEYDSLGEVPFEIFVGVGTASDGLTQRAKVDLHDPAFWEDGQAGSDQDPATPGEQAAATDARQFRQQIVDFSSQSNTKHTTLLASMGVKDVLSRKEGVIVGDDNVTSSSTVVAALEAARDNNAPIILQTSQGGAAYFAGKGVKNDKQQASIAGGIAAAHYIREIAPTYGVPVVLHTDHCAKKLLPWLDGLLDADEAYFKKTGEPLFSSHMIDLSEEPVDYNIETTAKYLKRAAPLKQWLEMEIGITGGEEDGVNNESVDNNALYTQPEDIHRIYATLKEISPYFSIAAGFGNVHGVYKPGNVKLHPELLDKHQKYVTEKEKTATDKPVFLVFHGGSGSTKKEYSDAISYGVVKVNLDTDLQWAYLSGIRDYILGKKDYLLQQVGNPDGEDKPNKKYFDPRVWVREGEKTMSARVAEGLKDFNTANQLMQSIASFSGDLASLTAPAFILSTQSLVEFSAYWTENLALFIAPTGEPDAGLRALLVLKWLINTLKQQYCSRSEKLGSEKKPLNPFLGELFLGHWDDEQFGRTRLISEQVSHHPPVTAYSIRNEKHGIHLQGYNGQKASFSNTIYVKQLGHALLTLTPPGASDGASETYLITLPELHIESLIYGTPFVELGKYIHVASSTGYIGKIDFAGRGWLSGKKNSFSAALWKDGQGSESKPLYSAHGQWSGDFEIREGGWKSHGKEVDAFSAAKSRLWPLTVAPVDQQDVFESRRAWFNVARSIEQGDMDKTAHFKARIENAQRALRRKEQEEKREWDRAFFTAVSSSAEADASEKVFQQLAAVLTNYSSVGSSTWDGVAADKTNGVWRLDEQKAQTASPPFHPEVGSLAIGETADAASAAASRVPTADDASATS